MPTDDIIEYTVAHGADVKTIIAKVNALIRSGWTPAGGVCMTWDYRSAGFAQALTRKVKA